ncbi:hypothetical protein, partial [Klebsiella quasipneumoniae]|uniref:hypothetical protein n=1 Tax=Klebsiella quasipneumoniae TaxID=1463165 RepID=UPI001CC92A54
MYFRSMATIKTQNAKTAGKPVIPGLKIGVERKCEIIPKWPAVDPPAIDSVDIQIFFESGDKITGGIIITMKLNRHSVSDD